MAKVAHLRSSAGVFGAERVILELSNFLPQLGFEPLIIAIWDDGDPYPEFLLRAKQRGIKCHAISCRGKFDLQAVKELRRICREEQVDILHCHGYKEDIFGLFVSLPKVATNHLWKRGDWATKIYSYLDALALQFFDQIVAVSKPIYQEMRQVLLPKGKMRVIPNGIDSTLLEITLSEQQKIEKRLKLSLNTSPVLITVSSLTKEKGHQVLLAALRLIQTDKYSVIIVGAGPERSRLEREVNESLLSSRVHFLGARDDIAQLLALSDIYLLPSHREGLPIALLEAMAAGKAIIASDVGDVAYALDGGEAGILVTPDSASELAAAIEKLLIEESRRIELAAKAKERLESYFSAQVMAEAYALCYRELC